MVHCTSLLTNECQPNAHVGHAHPVAARGHGDLVRVEGLAGAQLEEGVQVVQGLYGPLPAPLIIPQAVLAHHQPRLTNRD